MKPKVLLLFAILSLCLQVSIVGAVDPIVENADAVWNPNLDTTPTNLTNTASTALPRPLINYPDTAFNFELGECPEELIDSMSKALPRPLIEYPNTVFSFYLKEYPENLITATRKTLPRPLVEYPNTVLSKSLIFPKELMNGATPPITGDLNHDGTLPPADATIALRLAATGGWDADADVNHDSRITSLDALMILKAAG